MGRYQSITVKESMYKIATNEYLLPAIQRKFVWDSEQIEMLFDSVLRGYPINSFMFWLVKDREIKNNYKFYQFIKDFAKKYGEKNVAVDARLIDGFYAVIDGQQRMTSLYIGLCGTFRTKKPNKWWKYDEETMPTKKLYLDLSSPISLEIDNGKMYNFKFLSKDEVENDDKEFCWYEVGDIIKIQKEQEIDDFINKNDLSNNKFAKETLENLYKKINCDNLINYFEVVDQDQDKVLDIFIRTNSGGTPLSFSDLLMSIASQNWNKYDAREEIQKVRDEIFGYGSPSFNVNQDFVLKSILVLTDSDVKFNVSNFSKAKVASYEKDWDEIKDSLIETFKLLEQLGFNDNVLISKNAAIPIAYYIYKKKLCGQITKVSFNKKDKELIFKWLTMSLLKRIFGGQSDEVLRKIRNVIANSNSTCFPLDEIIDLFKIDPNKNYVFNNEVISSFLEEQYGSPISWLILGLLYPDVVFNYGKAIAQDHMHPKSSFENDKLLAMGIKGEKLDTYKKYYNTVLNLQLLESDINKQKNNQNLKEWAKNNKIDYKHLYIKQSTSLDITSFEKFIADRNEIMSKALHRKLN